MRIPGESYGRPSAVVVGGHPAGAETELEPAAGQHVEGGGLLGDHRRMLVVVAEHEHPDAQRDSVAAAANDSATMGARSVSTKWSGMKSVE